jgi:ADP-ribosyl-[dinitrogen reductase] hydrolase
VRTILTVITTHPKKLNVREDRAKGALVGLAVGDALGITAESGHSFQPKKLGDPRWVRDMRGRGSSYRPGDWSDDTSMFLALADSLIKRRGFVP